MTEILKIQEVAERMGCSPQWARKIAESEGKRMGAFRLTEGGHWRFRRDVFERWRNDLGTRMVEVDFLSGKVATR